MLTLARFPLRRPIHQDGGRQMMVSGTPQNTSLTTWHPNMTDAAEGPDWWHGSDGKWYAPELHPEHVLLPRHHLHQSGRSG